MPMLNNRVGEIRNNNNGTPMKIIEYVNSGNIVIEFLDGRNYTVSGTYNNFKRGTISSPYDRTAYNVGYSGIGKYETISNGIEYRTYKIWKELLGRCYPINEEGRKRHPAYEGCTVCEEWKCYQTFADWYENHYYDIGESTRMHLDKDVLVKGNKHYSPETCLILPQRINMIFMQKTKNKDQDLPNAIYRCTNGFKASYNGKSLGVFKTLDEAIEAHDNKMKIHILKVAEEYRGRIQDNAYQALINWTKQ